MTPSKPIKYGGIDTVMRRILDDIEFDSVNTQLIHNGESRNAYKRYTIKSINDNINGLLPEFLVLLDMLKSDDCKEIDFHSEKQTSGKYRLVVSWETAVG